MANVATPTTAPPAQQNGSLVNEKAVVEDASRSESLRSANSFQSTSSQPTPASTATADSTSIPTSTAREQEKGEEARGKTEEWKMPTDGPLKTPIPHPAASTKPTPQPELTPEQEAKYAIVLAAVSQWQTIPSSTAKNAPQAPIQDHERMFLTRECLLRYLRATKWKTADAIKRLQGTLSWRREYGADTFTHDYISPENETGKQVQLGFDQEQRPCLYLMPAKQNTKMSDRQIHHLCYMLDRTIDMMPPGVEANSLIIDFRGAASGSIPTVAHSRAVLNILQTHNPERLGKALICETPCSGTRSRETSASSTTTTFTGPRLTPSATSAAKPIAADGRPAARKSENSRRISAAPTRPVCNSSSTRLRKRTRRRMSWRPRWGS